MLNKMMKSFLLIIVCLIPLSGFAQDARPTPSPENLNIYTNYDRFEDTTTVTLSAYLAPPGFGPSTVFKSARLLVIGSVYGTDVKAAPHSYTAMVGLTTDSEDWVYLRGPHSFRVILDGGPGLLVGKMERVDGEVNRNRTVTETLRMSVPFYKIREIAMAERIEIQIGRHEFELNKTQVANLKEWVSRFSAPVAPAPTPSPAPKKRVKRSKGVSE